jgi:hypothetical protein
MSQITEFAADVHKTFDEIRAGIKNVEGDVRELVEALATTPEDQAALDSVRERGERIAADLATVAQIHEPTPPVEPEPEPEA